MIKYALQCDVGHTFEGWFGASKDFEDQGLAGLLTCPVCGSAAVTKQIMAPAVTGAKKRDVGPDALPKLREMMMEAAAKVREHVEENFDYVGDAFADEARAIHEGKSEDRGIYGEATAKEVQALVEDGVKVATLPAAAPKKTDVN
jgi:hypothetical protein